MSEETMQALRDAAASSAMEGLALSQTDLEIVEQIFSGNLTLEDYFKSIQLRTQEV